MRQMSSDSAVIDLTGHATRQAIRNAFGPPSELLNLGQDMADVASRAHLTMASLPPQLMILR